MLDYPEPIPFSQLKTGDYIRVDGQDVIFEEFIQHEPKKNMDSSGKFTRIDKPAKRRMVGDILLPERGMNKL